MQCVGNRASASARRHRPTGGRKPGVIFQMRDFSAPHFRKGKRESRGKLENESSRGKGEGIRVGVGNGRLIGVFTGRKQKQNGTYRPGGVVQFGVASTRVFISPPNFSIPAHLLRPSPSLWPLGEGPRERAPMPSFFHHTKLVGGLHGASSLLQRRVSVCSRLKLFSTSLFP